MTDLPATAPADVPAEAPATFESPQDADFQANFNKFMDHDFGVKDDDLPAEEPAPVVETQVSPEPPKAPVAPPASVPANGAQPAPATPAPAASGEEAGPSPEALAAMFAGMGLTEPQAPAAPAPTPAAAAPSPTPAAGSPSAEEAFAPFPQMLQVPDAIAQGLFEAEDPNTRKQALGVLMAAVANAVTQQVEARYKTVWQPAALQAYEGAAQARTSRETVQREFYGEHADLNEPHLGPIVSRAMNVVMQMNSNAKWDKETRAQIGNLARTAAKSLGITLKAGGAPPAASAAPQKPAAKTPYVAGGARPAGTGSSNRNTPAGMVEDLTFGDFG